MYREELETVVPCVRELLDALSGKTVVSADHGELLDDRLSGSTRGIRAPPRVVCRQTG